MNTNHKLETVDKNAKKFPFCGTYTSFVLLFKLGSSSKIKQTANGLEWIFVRTQNHNPNYVEFLMSQSTTKRHNEIII